MNVYIAMNINGSMNLDTIVRENTKTKVSRNENI